MNCEIEEHPSINMMCHASLGGPMTNASTIMFTYGDGDVGRSALHQQNNERANAVKQDL